MLLFTFLMLILLPVDDEEIAIAGDEEVWEWGEEVAGRLDFSDQVAENRLKTL